MSGDLKFDNMVDTGMAKEYMKLNPTFSSLGYSDTVEYEIDTCGNKIMFADYQRYIDLVSINVWGNQSSINEISYKLKALAELIEENKLLFAQIDYMVRKKPINESLNIDLKLIVQNILYVSSVMTKKRYISNVLAMCGTSQLCTLGAVAQLTCGVRHVVVETSPSTAVLCHLFVTLCRKAGLIVSLAFVKEPLLGDIDHDLLKEMQKGCICAVTERSDLDAAVHTFIASASQDPWRIRRVLVHESIVERLKQILEWKSKRNPNNGSVLECSSSYHVNDKQFVFEYTGLVQYDGHVVIEAYRTVKELLSLFSAYQPFAVSLWCADTSQANEIAYGINSTVVWINDYGSFYGPLKSSQAFYSIIDITYAKERIHHSFDGKSLTARRNNWMKLDASQRCKLLNLAIEKAEKNDVSRSLSIGRIDLNVQDGNFVEVANGGICVGLEMLALPLVLFREVEIKAILSCLLQGFPVVFSSLSETLGVVLSELEEVGAPLVYKGVDRTKECLVTSQFSQCKVKVIRTVFGTIFAN